MSTTINCDRCTAHHSTHEDDSDWAELHLNGQSYDICPACVSDLQGWLGTPCKTFSKPLAETVVETPVQAPTSQTMRVWTDSGGHLIGLGQRATVVEGDVVLRGIKGTIVAINPQTGMVKLDYLSISSIILKTIEVPAESIIIEEVWPRLQYPTYPRY